MGYVLLLKKNFRKKGILWLTVFLIVFFFFATGEFLYFRERSAAGLFVGEYYIGGKTFQEIEKIIKDIDLKMGKEKIRLILPDGRGTVLHSLSEMGLKIDEERLMREIKTLSRPFNYPEKFHIFRDGLMIPAYFIVDNDKMHLVFSRINNELYRSPVDAEVRAEKGALRFRPALKGQKAKTAHLSEEIQKRCSSWPAFPLDINIETEPLYPQITISDILASGIKEKIAAASTQFSLENQNRVHNISLAAKKIDNFLLTPGAVFSFNQVVGEASLKNGFKEAPVIVNEQFVMGAGGGICQVSSTIYNAALKAGLRIIERHNHRLSVSYLPPGLDATVAYDYLDLKFQNNLKTNILIHAYVAKNCLNVYFFGDPEQLTEVKILTQNQQLVSPPVHFRNSEDKPSSYREKIQEGKPGVTVEVYRVFYRGGQEFKREYLGKDSYSPVPEVWEIGMLRDEIS